MNSIEYWNSYKEKVKSTLVNAGSKTPVILTYGLSSEICEAFEVSAKEIIEGKELKEMRISELGDVLWYLVALEAFYDLPHPRYANYLGMPFELNAGEEVNLVEIHGEALSFASLISLAMADGEVDDIQYNINKILAVVFDVCMIYGINIVECFQANVVKMGIRHPDGYDKDAVKEHELEYKATKADIKSKGSNEILVDLKLDKRMSEPYKYITVKAFGESYKFDSGDIIIDFFKASNFISGKFKSDDYLINYSPNFRELLTQTVGLMFMGFMYEGDLISASDMRKRMKNKSEGNMVRLGKEGRPILMTANMQKLDDLLDYVNKNKK
jgi:hypothetical protein